MTHIFKNLVKRRSKVDRHIGVRTLYAVHYPDCKVRFFSMGPGKDNYVSRNKGGEKYFFAPGQNSRVHHDPALSDLADKLNNLIQEFSEAQTPEDHEFCLAVTIHGICVLFEQNPDIDHSDPEAVRQFVEENNLVEVNTLSKEEAADFFDFHP